MGERDEGRITVDDQGRPAEVDESQDDDDPRGEDVIRRELGPGDGDDPPPETGDEPSPR